MTVLNVGKYFTQDRVMFQVWCAVCNVGHHKVFSLNQMMTPTPYDIPPSVVY